jgi:hypothetical protein
MSKGPRSGPFAYRHTHHPYWPAYTPPIWPGIRPALTFHRPRSANLCRCRHGTDLAALRGASRGLGMAYQGGCLADNRFEPLSHMLPGRCPVANINLKMVHEFSTFNVKGFASFIPERKFEAGAGSTNKKVTLASRGPRPSLGAFSVAYDWLTFDRRTAGAQPVQPSLSPGEAMPPARRAERSPGRSRLLSVV